MARSASPKKVAKRAASRSVRRDRKVRSPPSKSPHRIRSGSKGKRYIVRRSKSGKSRREYLGEKGGVCAHAGKAKLYVGPKGGVYCISKGVKVYQKK